MRNRFPILILMAALILAGCGGGSQSASSSGSGSATATASAVNGCSGGTALSAGSYVVSWDAVSDARVTGYRIYYSCAPFSSPDTIYSVDVPGATTTTYTLKPAGMYVGTTLYVAVAARGDGDNESPMSEPQSIVLQ